MAPSTSIDALASALVARFLRTNNYSETLQAFIREASLPPDVGQSSGDDTNNWTIQKLLEEKKTFDQSVNFERYGQESKGNDLWSVPGKTCLRRVFSLLASCFLIIPEDSPNRNVESIWMTDDYPAPSKPTVIQTPTSSNILAASVDLWHKPYDAGDDSDAIASARSFIISTGADKQVHLLDTTPGNAALTSFSGLSDSPVLSYVSILQGQYVLMANMSGHLLLQHGSRILDSRKDHAKYVVKVVAYEEQAEPGLPRRCWVATAGWDSTIYLYRIDIPSEAQQTASSPVIGEPVARIKTTTNPESLLFVRNVDSGELFLLVSRRDSTHIYYYQVASPSSETERSSHQDESMDSQGSSIPECQLLGQQNLAPHSNAWVAFSPAHMALSPHDPGLLAVATSTLPHLKVMVARLLFPSPKTLGESSASASDTPMTQASQAFEALALQNREDAAILLQANTFAPQTAYSTPQVAWRPDGSGVWVNGDDGVVRGIEAKTGKVVAMLKDGHEPGSKVRTIWAGYVEVPGQDERLAREEWVISGGFDKRLVVWKV